MGSTGITKSTEVYDYSRKKTRVKRLIAWIVCLFIIPFSLFMGFLYASFQPFEMLRSLWVTSAMTTMNHQYLATWFFSDAEIKKIQQSNEAAILGDSNPSDINALSNTLSINCYFRFLNQPPVIINSHSINLKLVEQVWFARSAFPHNRGNNERNATLLYLNKFDV